MAIGLSVICFPFVSPALRKYCLPYVPATKNQIDNVLSSIVKQKNSKLLDIGSGDGRIVISAAKKAGLECHGVELNPWLVYYSRMSALANSVYGRTKFYRRDLWKFDVSPYDNIVIFGVEQMVSIELFSKSIELDIYIFSQMEDLEKKLLNEVRKDSTIIACRFKFPNMEPIKTIDAGVDTVWVYKR